MCVCVCVRVCVSCFDIYAEESEEGLHARRGCGARGCGVMCTCARLACVVAPRLNKAISWVGARQAQSLPQYGKEFRQSHQKTGQYYTGSAVRKDETIIAFFEITLGINCHAVAIDQLIINRRIYESITNVEWFMAPPGHERVPGPPDHRKTS